MNDYCNSKPFNLTVYESYYLAMYRAVGDINPNTIDYPVCLTNKINADKARKYERGQHSF